MDLTLIKEYGEEAAKLCYQVICARSACTNGSSGSVALGPASTSI
jgi:hypothetical protein